jgi:hypothetical protein
MMVKLQKWPESGQINVAFRTPELSTSLSMNMAMTSTDGASWIDYWGSPIYFEIDLLTVIKVNGEV